MAAQEYDAIVIGGGHNGLITAHYLAKEGLSVLVLERLEKIGGPGHNCAKAILKDISAPAPAYGERPLGVTG